MCFWFAETHNAIILVSQLGCLPIGKKADFLFLFYSLVKHWNFRFFYKLIKQWLTLWDGGLPDPIESVLDWLGMRLGPLNNWQENSDLKIRRKDSFMLTSNHINNNGKSIYKILSKFGGTLISNKVKCAANVPTRTQRTTRLLKPLLWYHSVVEKISVLLVVWCQFSIFDWRKIVSAWWQRKLLVSCQWVFKKSWTLIILWPIVQNKCLWTREALLLCCFNAKYLVVL